MSWKQSKSKFHNKPVTFDGIRYDSKNEMLRHNFLKMMEQAGEISNLRYHVNYTLIPKGVADVTLHFPDGDRHIQMKFDRERFYEADFVYVNKNGEEIVEDFKGFETDTFKQKRILFRAIYGKDIKLAKTVNASVE